MLLVLLGVLLSAKPAPAAKVFVPCPQATPEWTAAHERLVALDAKLESLPEGVDGKPGVAALRELLSSRCFELSREVDEPVPEDVSLLALKDWWRRGGRTWVESYLELGKPGVRTVVLPPTVREVLMLDTVKPDHRLAPWLCALADSACMKETEPWAVRAEASFAANREEQAKHLASIADADAAGEGYGPAFCEKEARKKAKRWRYPAWRLCLSSHGASVRMLPLTGLRVPSEGWLVLRGRRGHYSFCDEVRAYHLGTGTAWVSQSCSELALYEDAERIGRVDVKTTDANRQARVAVGTVSRDALRELTWMLLLSGELDDVRRLTPIRQPVPQGFAIEWRELPDDFTVVGGVSGGVVWGNTGQTVLRWTWFPPERGEPLSGELTWPEASDPADDHADTLVVALEKTFQAGCPTRPAPLDLLDFTRPTPVNRVDAPEGVAQVQDARVTALRDWKPPPGCAVPGK
ncbi:hypothetical protein SAMN05443572_106242 [Myxococcus fulvus]|uniref:Lipoprotein n=1 Tax=Myxococcus fulvus TaxID=33 RepID=A0A511T444_MYXFU|nr:hypothetical protein [Myxococcus fulvus]GEN08332.1 hypothetical protein MFU01_33690 [Myxococcus fulvus]SEU21206.1 hypothetical protein SAMN05443572_106242 [Myxococcus fulvus]